MKYGLSFVVQNTLDMAEDVQVRVNAYENESETDFLTLILLFDVIQWSSLTCSCSKRPSAA